MTGSCEHGIEFSGPLKGREFLDQMSDYASQKGLCLMGVDSWYITDKSSQDIIKVIK
jgi:hypothetical protein